MAQDVFNAFIGGLLNAHVTFELFIANDFDSRIASGRRKLGEDVDFADTKVLMHSEKLLQRARGNVLTKRRD